MASIIVAAIAIAVTIAIVTTVTVTAIAASSTCRPTRPPPCHTTRHAARRCTVLIPRTSPAPAGRRGGIRLARLQRTTHKWAAFTVAGAPPARLPLGRVDPPPPDAVPSLRPPPPSSALALQALYLPHARVDGSERASHGPLHVCRVSNLGDLGKRGPLTAAEVSFHVLRVRIQHRFETHRLGRGEPWHDRDVPLVPESEREREKEREREREREREGGRYTCTTERNTHESVLRHYCEMVYFT